jgi:hypothetical protein
MQRLVGKLNFFGQAIRSSRAFLRRFYDIMSPLKKPYNMLRLARETKAYLSVWAQFLKDFNGTTYIQQDIWFSSDSFELYTDAAGAAGFGAGCYFGGQ